MECVFIKRGAVGAVENIRGKPCCKRYEYAEEDEFARKYLVNYSVEKFIKINIVSMHFLRILTFNHKVDKAEQVASSESTFYKSALLYPHQVTKVDGQPVTDIPLPDFEIGK